MASPDPTAARLRQAGRHGVVRLVVHGVPGASRTDTDLQRFEGNRESIRMQTVLHGLRGVRSHAVMNKRRLFFALWPDDRQRDYLRNHITSVAKSRRG